MKTLKTFESIFDVLWSSYYKVGLRSPFEYASINKRSKSNDIVYVQEDVPSLKNGINLYPTIMFFIRYFGHNKTIYQV